VDWVTNGYTWAVRIMFGFSVKEALKGNNQLYKKRKLVLFELLDLILPCVNINKIGDLFSVIIDITDEDFFITILRKIININKTILPSIQENINELIEFIEESEKKETLKPDSEIDVAVEIKRAKALKEILRQITDK
jgi:hypothetical protein